MYYNDTDIDIDILPQGVKHLSYATGPGLRRPIWAKCRRRRLVLSTAQNKQSLLTQQQKQQRRQFHGLRFLGHRLGPQCEVQLIVFVTL